MIKNKAKKLTVQLGENERVETGGVQFNDDWPGLFIRGDDCILLANLFMKIQNGKELTPMDSYNLGHFTGLIIGEVLIDPSVLKE